MDENPTTLLLIALAGALLVGIVYLLTKPQPQASSDISAQQLGTLIVIAAEVL
jgi:hypothetical protein